MRSTTMTNQLYGWQRRYEAAILETDRSRLPALIEVAQSAIDARIEELQSDHLGTREEMDALADALAGLRVLRKELA
jgi:hypothetical protein